MAFMAIHETYHYHPMAAGISCRKGAGGMGNRLTYEKGNGEWSLKGHDIKQVPGELYGFFCKLHAYEKSGMTPDEVENMKEDAEGRKWIPCSEKLPAEPDGNAGCLTAEELEQLIINDVLKEYLVTIYGSVSTTTLFYAGNGEWYDPVTQEYYKVVAWMPMPEAYKG